jgi:hypothetical protein
LDPDDGMPFLLLRKVQVDYDVQLDYWMDSDNDGIPDAAEGADSVLDADAFQIILM